MDALVVVTLGVFSGTLYSYKQEAAGWSESMIRCACVSAADAASSGVLNVPSVQPFLHLHALVPNSKMT